AAEQHGHRTKKTLEIDPIQAETVRLIFRLAREGDGRSGPMGVKSTSKHLNTAGIRTRDGGRWGVGSVHKVLTRTTYIGRHRFNTTFWKTRERKPDTEVVEMAVPPIIDAAEFRGRANAPQVPQSGPDRAAHRKRPDTAHGHLLLRGLRQGDDAPDREGRTLPVLHLLDQGAAGRDGLPRPHRADGQARPCCGRPHRAAPVAAEAPRANPLLSARPPRGARGTPNSAYRRIAQASERSRRQTQAALRRHRER